LHEAQQHQETNFGCNVLPRLLETHRCSPTTSPVTGYLR
jgi:hypothetical protein